MSDLRRIRTDVVGSLLRPAAWKEARLSFEGGLIDARAFARIERQCIQRHVRLQESVGLDVVTDGELSRLNFQDSFGLSVSGYAATPEKVETQEERAARLMMDHRTAALTFFGGAGALVFGLWYLLRDQMLVYALLRTQLFDIDLKVKWTIKQSTVAGVFIGIYANQKYDAQFEGNPAPCQLVNDVSMCTPAGATEQNRAITIANVGTGFGVAGVVLMGTAAVLFFTAPKDVVVVPTATASAGGLAVVGRF